MAPWHFWKNRPGVHSQTSLKRSMLKLFSNCLWTNIALGPGPRALVWGIFERYFENRPLTKWKRILAFKDFWKWDPCWFSKMSPSHFFKVSPFSQGRRPIGVWEAELLEKHCRGVWERAAATHQQELPTLPNRPWATPPCHRPLDDYAKQNRCQNITFIISYRSRSVSLIKSCNFETMSTWHSWKSAWNPFSKIFEEEILFKLFWKKGPFSNCLWTNTAGQGPGGLGPRPNEVFVQRQFENIMRNVFFFQICLKIGPRPVFKNVRSVLSKFHYLARDVNH